MNYNDEIKNNLENLKIQAQIFAEEYEINREDKPIFSEFVLELMDRKKWDRPIFKDRTLLSDSAYTRLISKKKRQWEHHIVIAIAVGLKNF